MRKPDYRYWVGGTLAYGGLGILQGLSESGKDLSGWTAVGFALMVTGSVIVLWWMRTKNQKNDSNGITSRLETKITGLKR